MKRYDFMVLEWIDVPGKGQPILGHFTHYCKNDERARVMAEKLSDDFEPIVAVITLEGDEVISAMLPVSVPEKGGDAWKLGAAHIGHNGVAVAQ